MDRGGFNLEAAFPHQCPCCGQPTRVHETKGRDENGKERIIKTLFCDNATCETRKLKKFVHFVSKKAMNIEGLSEATLEKLIGRGWIHSYLDLYRLDQHRDEIIRMEGFGVKSWQRLWDAVQQSRNTTFERYVIARYVLPKGKVEGDGANMRIELPIPEKAGKKAVLIGRGQWEV